MAEAAKQASFGPQLFSFLTDLRANNNREWFAANKQRYEEQLLEPALAFIEAFAPRLEKISPHFLADPRPSGGSLFRIYRDTRFAKDKSPYKTNLGIHFRHERAKDAHAPGYYLHIGPDEVSAGGGIWHPATDAATTIREAIVADPALWQHPTKPAAFAKKLGLGGASLNGVPPGANPAPPSAAAPRRRNSSSSARPAQSDVVTPRFIAEYARLCQAAAPLMHFL